MDEDIKKPEPAEEAPPPPSDGAGCGLVSLGVGGTAIVVKIKLLIGVLLWVASGIKWIFIVSKGAILFVSLALYLLVPFKYIDRFVESVAAFTRAGAVFTKELIPVIAKERSFDSAVLAAHNASVQYKRVWEISSAGSSNEAFDDRLAVYAVFPVKDKDYAAVFGKPASPNDLDKFSSARGELEKNARALLDEHSDGASLTKLERKRIHDSDEGRTPGTITFSSPEDGPAVFYKMLSEPERKVILFIGHNEAGTFKFPIGELKLEKMAQDCDQWAKMCVFISCDSSEFLNGLAPGVERAITPLEAVGISRSISHEISIGNVDIGNKELFVRDVTTVTLIESKNLNVTARVRLVVYSTGGISIPGAVLIELDVRQK